MILDFILKALTILGLILLYAAVGGILLAIAMIIKERIDDKYRY